MRRIGLELPYCQGRAGALRSSRSSSLGNARVMYWTECLPN
ncbi:gp54, conserved hypothetical protein [Burkholderia phage phi644-2]|uniref:Uncharacterized protein n=1 Tax=Burkholderia phage phi644-2 TaxID=2881400 RepID=A4JX49_9CAUD|nr:gp54, conserved hypothetical protein [Burkholderia phage phi644-2]ABO60851.1 gp54, conserved hypothetical protein [Burkholderia phage phi644-2]